VRRTSRLVLLLGIFLAALTFVVVLFLGQGNQPTPTPVASEPANLPTVVAAVDIPLGTIVTQDMVTSRVLPVPSREANVLGDVSQAVGKTTQRAILVGQQVHTTDFQVRAVELTVPVGQRAISIAVNELSGVAALVTTGDRVDVVVTLTGAQFPLFGLTDEGIPAPIPGVNPLTTKLILQDIQVIGTLSPGVPAQPAQGNQPARPAVPGYVGDFPVGSKLVVIAVTPQQAEVLVFARTINSRNTFGNPDQPFSQIDLALRSPTDAGILAETTGVILRTLVDDYGVLPPELVPVPIPSPEN
jgi:Flp pilus assembly protein CpaB